MRIARFQIEQINLVERIVRVTFALKYQRFAVGGEVPFSTSFSFKGQLPDASKKLRFLIRRANGIGSQKPCGQRQLDERATQSAEDYGYEVKHYSWRRSRIFVTIAHANGR